MMQWWEMFGTMNRFTKKANKSWQSGPVFEPVPCSAWHAATCRYGKLGTVHPCWQHRCSQFRVGLALYTSIPTAGQGTWFRISVPWDQRSLYLLCPRRLIRLNLPFFFFLRSASLCSGLNSNRLKLSRENSPPVYDGSLAHRLAPIWCFLILASMQTFGRNVGLKTCQAHSHRGMGTRTHEYTLYGRKYLDTGPSHTFVPHSHSEFCHSWKHTIVYDVLCIFVLCSIYNPAWHKEHKLSSMKTWFVTPVWIRVSSKRCAMEM